MAIPSSARVHPNVVIRRDNPYPGYEQLLRIGPVLRALDGSILVVGHDAATLALKDPRLVSRAPFPGTFGGDGFLDAIVSFSSGEAHVRRRAFMARAFQPRILGELVPRLEALVDELLDALEGKRRVDLVEALARPFPVRVIAEILGLPRERHADCVRWSDATAPVADAVIDREQIPTIQAAGREFADYLVSLIAERRRRPGPDPLSEMIARLEPAGLTELDLVANVMNLFVAGHETTTSLIGNAFALLDRNPLQRKRLEDEPALLSSAIEEILRFAPPLQFVSRVAEAPLELGGLAIAAETPVWVLVAAANRDPAQFPLPGLFEIARAPNPHLSFGSGTHFCLGAPLARLEATCALERFFARFPRWKVVDPAPPLREMMALRGYASLQVEL